MSLTVTAPDDRSYFSLKTAEVEQMPRFYFDIDDGERLTTDAEGVVCRDLGSVRDSAISILPDVAREELPDGDRRVFVCKARDEGGAVVFIATLTLIAEWIEKQPNRGSP